MDGAVFGSAILPLLEFFLERVVARRFVFDPLGALEICERLGKLFFYVHPFAHAKIGKKVRLAEFAELALRALLEFLVHAFPNIEQSEEVGFTVNETFVGGASELFFSERTFSGILYRES